MQADELMALEAQYGARNYHPLPVVLSRGEGVYVWDLENRRYFDFLSAYSAVNQGHCHPRLLETLQDQARRLTLTSRAFYNDVLGQYAQYLCEYFGFARMLPMNTGAEAVETAIKLCRKWAYQKRQIPEGEALILVADGNFHGRTTTIISFSNDPDARNEYGPYTPGFENLPYNDLDALEKALNNPRVAGFLVEPIQGEAGVIVPDEGYLGAAARLCREAGVLLIADEIQTGVGRTGRMLAVDHEDVRPDLVILGKALSGGMYPVSAVLADDEVMLCMRPGEHGSTYGGNPLACRLAMTALAIVRDEQLCANAERMGQLFRDEVAQIDSPLIGTVRGKGLLNAVVIEPTDGKEAWDLCLKLAENGLLAKPTHRHCIRFSPPLVISEEQMQQAIAIIRQTVAELV